MKTELPEWAREFALSDSRYKVAWGGRAAGRSWTFGALMLLRASEQRTICLCARETQESISDSVHRVLANTVDRLGLPGWDVQQYKLVHANGSEITFCGIRTDPAKIKSTEGVDICWVEEAEAVSENSWAYLTPTIRKSGSQIWVTFNTRFETDPTYKRFVISPPQGALIRKVSFRDNPWHNAEMESERRHMLQTDPDAYACIWEGEPARSTLAQVLSGKVSVRTFEAKDTWDGPYYGIDWGFATDPTAANRCWIHNDALWIDYEAHGVRGDESNDSEIDALPGLLMKVPGMENHVARADCSRPETISYVKRHGFPKIQACRKWPKSVEDGVARLRGFSEIVIHPRCEHTILETRLYSHKVDKLSGDVLPEILDKHNHHMDALRYAIQPLLYGERRQPEPEPESEREDWGSGSGSSGNSWMAY